MSACACRSQLRGARRQRAAPRRCAPASTSSCRGSATSTRSPPSTSGKIEIESLEEGRDGVDPRQPGQGAVLTVFKERVVPEQVRDVIAAFEEGARRPCRRRLARSTRPGWSSSAGTARARAGAHRRRRIAGGGGRRGRVRARRPAPVEAPEQGLLGIPAPRTAAAASKFFGKSLHQGPRYRRPQVLSHACLHAVEGAASRLGGAMTSSQSPVSRSRWAALGAAVAVSLGVGGVAVTNAVVSTGEKAVLVPISPCRLFDLRPAPLTVGPRSTPLGPGETYTQPVHGVNGNCTIPADATAVAMNVTAVGGTAGSFLTIWPSDVSPQPLASNLNWVPGSPPTPNKVDVKLSATGSINLFNLTGDVSVLADVVGYYADHNHDDRYYTKTQSDAQLATKANASMSTPRPRSTDCHTSSVVAGGMVSGTGTIDASTFPRFGTTWTVTRNSAGSYSVFIPGLNPGCQDPAASTDTCLVQRAPTGPSTTAASVSSTAVPATPPCRSPLKTPRVPPPIGVSCSWRTGRATARSCPSPTHPGATECTVRDGVVECV